MRSHDASSLVALLLAVGLACGLAGCRGATIQAQGSRPAATPVAEDGRTPDPTVLAKWCGETLAAFKVPTEWELRAEPLPRNPSGKVLKNVLMGESASRFVEE